MDLRGTEVKIDRPTATAIAREHVNPALTVVDMKPLHGGMINRVEEWLTDGEPASIVVKVTGDVDCGGFRGEFAMLDWYRGHTQFPVPQPYACVSDEKYFQGTCLLMAKLAGRHLGQARLTRQGRAAFQSQLARHLMDLHEHKRDKYGSALKADGLDRWLDWFGPLIERNYTGAKEQLSSRTRQTVTALIKRLDQWLPESADPTLVHGDLWAANIMVDDRDGDRPVISGFIDGGVNYCDVEYELAYLRVFNTADDAFFREYTRRHALREGFDRRCRIYWLNTMLIHVWYFGAAYLSACEGLAREIERLS